MKIMINNLFYRTGLRQNLIVQPWLTKLNQNYDRFMINVDRFMINVLQDWLETKAYCATLAHKTNHSFTPNCQWDNFFHPR